MRERGTDRHVRAFLPIAAIVHAALAVAAAGQSPDIPSFARDVPAIRAGAPIFRFNGKDLTGFYTYLREHHYDDPAGVFTVEDGLLRISGEEFGGLTTRAEYRDYHLVMEWKWGERTFGSRKNSARDSGILLHCVGPDGAAGGMWMESQECQVIEGGCGDLLMVNGREKPSLTCETRIGPDRQFYFEKGERPSPETRADLTGGGVTLAGKTSWAFAAVATSRSRPASGIGSK